MKKYLLPFLFLLFALPVSSQYVHRNTLIGTGWKVAGSKSSPMIGTGVAISADGNVAVVCAAQDSAARGAAWVYTRNGTTWTQMGKKLAPQGFVMASTLGVYFGNSVAISANGNTIAIGGHVDNAGKGATWIFERQGNFWIQQGPKLVGSLASAAAYQGEAISLSADGNTLLVGGRLDAGSDGGAWVFQRTGSTWAQQGPKFFLSNNISWAFGSSVALTADGNTALIGAPLQTLNSVNNTNGFAYFYRRTGSVWNMVQMVTDSAFTDSGIGGGVAISANGKVAAIAGPEYDNNSGAVWIYRFNQAKQKWAKEQVLYPPTGSYNFRLGKYLSISRGGDTLVASAHTVAASEGSVYIYTYSNGSWSMLTGLNSPVQDASNGPNFGRSVSLSGNGKMLFVGRPGGTATGNGPGAAFVFYTPDILGRKNELEPKLKLHPNPVKGFLYLPATANYTQLTISDLNGKVLLHQTKPAQRLDLSTFSAGIYIVSLHQRDIVHHVRIVKE